MQKFESVRTPRDACPERPRCPPDDPRCRRSGRTRPSGRRAGRPPSGHAGPACSGARLAERAGLPVVPARSPGQPVPAAAAPRSGNHVPSSRRRPAPP
ncbi:MAG: hypothetical protein EOP38_27775, partial [Rubrivivax sp.]